MQHVKTTKETVEIMVTLNEDGKCLEICSFASPHSTFTSIHLNSYQKLSFIG